LTSGFKNAIMTFFTKYGPAPCDKKCRSEHQTLFLLFGLLLGGYRLSHFLMSTPNFTCILPPDVSVPTPFVPISTPHQCLHSFLISQNRPVHNILLDGSCMFWALSHQLYGSDEHHIQVRSMLHKGWSLPYAL